MNPFIKLSHLLLLFTVLAFAQCSGNKNAETDTTTIADDTLPKQEADVTKAVSKPEFTVDQVFQKQISALFAAYLVLKEGFVSSDAAKVKAEAAKVKETLGQVDMKLVADKAHTDWMIYQGQISESLSQIESSSEIEKQREAFSTMSDSMYKIVKAYGLGGVTAYYEFCPMAFNDKGAYWLSDTEKIRNPYFGDQMLTCGSVQETLQ